MVPHSWGFLYHTQRRTTVGRTPLDEWSVRRRDLYLTTQNTHNRQTSMPPVGFEPTIPAGERQQTYALDREAGHWDRHGFFFNHFSESHEANFCSIPQIRTGLQPSRSFPISLLTTTINKPPKHTLLGMEPAKHRRILETALSFPAFAYVLSLSYRSAIRIWAVVCTTSGLLFESFDIYIQF